MYSILLNGGVIMESVRWQYNLRARENEKTTSTEILSLQEVHRAWKFHQSFAMYQETPLRSLERLAHHLGVAGVYVKDESYRFGLNAFKVLGGVYAIGRYLSEQLEIPIEELSFDLLRSKEIRQKLGDITFTTATDGNHGRGVAWAAQQLGQKAVIYMPKGSSHIRLQHILDTGAEGYIVDMNYDDAVRLSADNARKNGWVVVQDTAWEGYTDIPTWIMQGYATLALEALDQLKATGVDKPTHVFLQAGVGSYAGAILGVLVSTFGEEHPITTIVEPDTVDCLYRSALADEMTSVTGDLDTIMAGLACGEPNPISWEILRNHADFFVTCPDYVAAHGMRVLGNPICEDARVISGESGAVTTGLISLLMTSPHLQNLRDQLQLNNQSHILVISTEGDTDPEHYRKVVWDGKSHNSA